MRITRQISGFLLAVLLFTAGGIPAAAQPGQPLDGSFAGWLAVRRVPVDDLTRESGDVLLLTPQGPAVSAATVAANPSAIHVIGWQDATHLLMARAAQDTLLEVVRFDAAAGTEQVLASGLPAGYRLYLTPDRAQVIGWLAAGPLTELAVYDAAVMTIQTAVDLSAYSFTDAGLAGVTAEHAVLVNGAGSDALLTVALATGAADGPFEALAAGDGPEQIADAVLLPDTPLALVGRLALKDPWGLYTLPLTNEGVPTAAQPHPMPEEVQHVTWRPDGEGLAVVTAVPGDLSGSSIFLTGADAAVLSEPVRAAYDSCVAFTPDSRWLLYVGTNGGALLAVPVSDPAAAPQLLYNGEALLDLCEAAWQPAQMPQARVETSAASLRPGDAVTGTLDNDRPSVAYPLALEAGETITLSLERLSGDLDPLLVLLGPDGTEIIRNDDALEPVGGTHLNAQIPGFTAPAAGTYTVRAARFFEADGLSSGDFRLSLTAGDASPAPAAAAIAPPDSPRLAVGDALTGAISDDRYRVDYTLILAVNQTVTILLERMSGDLDPYLILLDASGRELAVNDDADVPFGGIPLNARLDFTPPADGVYTVRATRYAEDIGVSTGEYQISVMADQRLLAAGDLHVGGSVGDTITDASPVKDYTIQLEAGQAITVTMEALDAVLDPYLIVLDARGRELAYNDDAAEPVGSSTYNARIANFTAPETGPYTIRATRFLETDGITTGPFRLTISAGAPGGDAASPDFLPEAELVIGSTVQGEITDEITTVDYPILLEAGTTIAVTMTAQNDDLDALVIILDPGDTIISYNDDALTPVGGNDYNAQITGFTAPVTGVYTIQATRFNIDEGDTAGPFTLTVDIGQPSEAVDGGPIAVGASATGELSESVFAVDYSLALAAGEEITVSMEALDKTLDPELIILDAFGNELAYNDDAEIQVGGNDLNAQIAGYAPRTAGTYTIRATRFLESGGTSVGRFRITVEAGAAAEEGLNTK